jgi:hypothetical protein
MVLLGMIHADTIIAQISLCWLYLHMQSEKPIGLTEWKEPYLISTDKISKKVYINSVITLTGIGSPEAMRIAMI